MKDERVAPEGKYKAHAITARYDQIVTRAGDELECVKVKFKIVDGDHKGKIVEWTGWFGDDQTKNKYSLDALTNCGWMGTDLTDLMGVTANEVKIVVTDREVPGKDGIIQKSVVRYVNSLGPSRKPGGLPSKGLQDKIKALRAAPSGAPDVLHALGDDDVPF